MPRLACVYDVLIASPSDVPEDRDAAESAILAWNAMNRDSGLALRPVRWERDAVPLQGARPQDLLNSQFVDNCDLGIGIFWTRLGTATGTAASGTVEELDRLETQSKPVLLYFCDRPPDITQLDAAQLQALQDYRAARQANGLQHRYQQPADLRAQLLLHLTHVVPTLPGCDTPTAAGRLPNALISGDLVDEERGRPEFAVQRAAGSRIAAAFTPEFSVVQTAGATTDAIEWRISALGQDSAWTQTRIAHLPRARLRAEFNLTAAGDSHVGDLWFHLRCNWQERWYHERHRWPLMKLQMVGRVLWDIGDEMLPPQRWSSLSPDDVAPPAGRISGGSL